MCGINCIFDPKDDLPNKQALINYMNDQMPYRGPDDAGIYCDDSVALGMRRLSIIDVGGGHQPLYNEDRTLVLVCNGEIYNYVELMDDLKARGHQFMSGSDTETILHLYEEKGTACLEDLRGMFAFVLWDTRRQRLFAARDRVGIKPLYLTQLNGQVWLSSELKTLVGVAVKQPTLNQLTTYQFLLYGYAIDQRQTVIQEVQRLLPGEFLLADGTSVSVTRYWQPHFGGTKGLASYSDAEILTTLEESVQLHLRSDVPVGILLSGGIDSATVAAFAARSSDNYVALCAGYAGDDLRDERQAAHATARQLGLPYQDVVLDMTMYRTLFDQVVTVSDEPVGDRAAMPQWALYAQARSAGYKVVLSGIGGDEVFFGYGLWNRVIHGARSLPSADHATWVGIDQYPSWADDWRLLQRLSRDDSSGLLASINAPLHELHAQTEWGPDVMASVLFGTYLVHNGCLLADKLGMGCSVEARVPFLDHILIERVFSLPLSQRFDPLVNKPFLRRALQSLLNQTVLDAPKRGFTPPSKLTEQLVLDLCPMLLDGHLGAELFVHTELEHLIASVRALRQINIARVRGLLGIARPVDFLFRMLAFEQWYAKIQSMRRFVF